MNEIYWITRLDGIIIVSCIILSFSLFIAIFGIIILFVNNNSDNDDEDLIKKGKLMLRYSIPTIVISILFCIFIPTTNEAYMIYGVGSTIDYFKSSKDAKALPDKTIKALNVFLDKECKQNNDNKENN